MARIRSVKPEFWADECLARDLTREQRLAYIGLWNEADDEGRLRGNSRKLLGAILPYDEDLDERFVDDLLVRLADTNRAVLYVIGGEKIVQLTKFSTHQKVHKPTPSKLPPPPRGAQDPARRLGWLSREILEATPEASGTPPGFPPLVVEVEVGVEVEVDHGSGSGSGVGVTREVENGPLALIGPHSQPTDQPESSTNGTTAPDQFGGFLAAAPSEVRELLAALRHDGGLRASAATIEHRFLFPDGQESLADPVVRGLLMTERVRLVTLALLEFATQAEPFSRPHFTGYVRRIRDADAKQRAGAVSPGRYEAQDDDGPVVSPEEVRKLAEATLGAMRRVSGERLTEDRVQARDSERRRQREMLRGTA